MSFVPIPQERAMVVWQPLPRVVEWRGQRMVTYDYELLIGMMKRWHAEGWSKETCMEFVFSA